MQVVPNNSDRLLKIGSHNGLVGLFSTEFDGHSQLRGGRSRQRAMRGFLGTEWTPVHYQLYFVALRDIQLADNSKAT